MILDFLRKQLAPLASTPPAPPPGQDLETLARAQLKRDEGEVLYAYTDSEGYLTIGIGRLIDKRKGGGISAEESAYLFSNDFNSKLGELRRLLPWFDKLDVARQGVLLNMAFQMGVDGLLGFKNTLAMVERGDYTGASAGMLSSLWAKQTPARAARLSMQMETGQWQ